MFDGFWSLGDMLELGSEAADHHYQIGRYIADAKLDGLAAVGEFSDEIVRGAIDGGMSVNNTAMCCSHDALHTVLDGWLQSGNVVLVKGSRSTRMETVVEWITSRSETRSVGNRQAA